MKLRVHAKLLNEFISLGHRLVSVYLIILTNLWTSFQSLFSSWLAWWSRPTTSVVVKTAYCLPRCWTSNDLNFLDYVLWPEINFRFKSWRKPTWQNVIWRDGKGRSWQRVRIFHIRKSRYGFRTDELKLSSRYSLHPSRDGLLRNEIYLNLCFD